MDRFRKKRKSLAGTSCRSEASGDSCSCSHRTPSVSHSGTCASLRPSSRSHAGDDGRAQTVRPRAHRMSSGAAATAGGRSPCTDHARRRATPSTGPWRCRRRRRRRQQSLQPRSSHPTRPLVPLSRAAEPAPRRVDGPSDACALCDPVGPTRGRARLGGAWGDVHVRSPCRVFPCSSLLHIRTVKGLDHAGAAHVVGRPARPRSRPRSLEDGIDSALMRVKNPNHPPPPPPRGEERKKKENQRPPPPHRPLSARCGGGPTHRFARHRTSLKRLTMFFADSATAPCAHTMPWSATSGGSGG